jgi:hypothetical protein
LGWSGSSVTTPKNIGRYIDRLYGELSLKRQASLQRWLLEEENRYGFRSWQLDLVEQHAQRLGIVSEKDVLASKRPTVQIDVDATALTQAGVGASYLQNIVEREASGYLQHREGTTISPIDLVMRTAFTPNHNSEWFLAIMADINNITMLTHRSYGGGADSRTRTRNRRAPAGDAGQAGRNHDRENLGQRSCD